MTTANETTLPFVANLHPHRSLGARGFRTMMAVMVFIVAVYGGVFVAAGAWPVLGFLGLEVALLYVLFQLNYRAAREREHIRIDCRDTQVRKRAANGRETTHAFQTFWLRIEEDRPEGRNGTLTLRSHGKAVTVGTFLSPPERQDLAHALRRAVASVGGPTSGA